MAPSWAGRPLGTDDATTAEAGLCQVESWFARDREQRAWVVSPACGLAPGLELDADRTRLAPADPVRGGATVAVKWVPQAANWDSPVGALNVGLKFSTGFEQRNDAGWRRASGTLLGLATLRLPGDWAVNANLGPARDRASGATATWLNLALVWTPADEVLLFVERQANDRPAEFGGSLRTTGARWWLLKDRLGLDLTAGRQAGRSAGTVWTIGFGGYGLGF